ncbi:proteasome subunit alpha [Pseudonocardia sp.]|uniref:proteasome subunit alpha n=1 Tax=Pseudonocardia sp. TaxID=60912 RepID=UPI002DAD95EF|nr:proteasome subunit alpha [Pseudonocardia sp.]
MTMPFYSSVDQLLRDRSELARKGIARGRSVVVLTYTGGVLFVAENRSSENRPSALRKVSEIYDRIGFAAVGRYNEFETLRNAGIRMADVRGYSYDRRDVTGRMLANYYAQVLGTSFVEQQKPYEVELCLAAVGETPEADQLYRITYDGSITDEPQFVVMGGTTEPISAKLKDTYRPGMELAEAIGIAVEGLQATGTPAGSGPTGSNGGAQATRVLGANALEVAVLDRSRPHRTFRRITGQVLRDLLPEENRAVDAPPPPTVAGDDVPAASGAVNGDQEDQGDKPGGAANGS